MIRARVIPCLLLKGQGLYKTVKFKDPKYVGDPINAVKIFNEKEVDELALLDIAASVEGKGPNFAKIEEVAGECFMPLAYGGGIRTLEDIRTLFALGVEKVILNSYALAHPDLVREASELFGSQSIVASIDVKRGLLGGYEVVTHSGTRKTGRDPVQAATDMVAAGAGEYPPQQRRPRRHAPGARPQAHPVGDLPRRDPRHRLRRRLDARPPGGGGQDRRGLGGGGGKHVRVPGKAPGGAHHLSPVPGHPAHLREKAMSP